MQPQETGFDWWHALSGMVGATIGAGSTLLTWIIRAARMEPTIRAEIVAAEQRVEQKIDDKIESEMGHFRETLNGIREKINEVEREALPREDFKEFLRQHREDLIADRQERREDFAELKRNIAEIVGRKH
ncbi:hypothetical protein [Bradyrhizobium sp. SZCCHNRI1073]|uniref:hypothetical protein n=1 Tax=Bradyrhizobium sp. SZCCHNRI1073 TaxID=3057280 RepID=UPI002915E1CC|nr:hypothetical protein [Bradyrhizobium sp. SZCCHNRI1073]